MNVLLNLGVGLVIAIIIAGVIWLMLLIIAAFSDL